MSWVIEKLIGFNVKRGFNSRADGIKTRSDVVLGKILSHSAIDEIGKAQRGVTLLIEYLYLINVQSQTIFCVPPHSEDNTVPEISKMQFTLTFTAALLALTSIAAGMPEKKFVARTIQREV